MVYINPKWVLVEFLRSKLLDPRASRRPVFRELTITTVGSQSEFDLTFTPNHGLSYVESVTLDGTPVVKWEDYYIDFRNSRIVFFVPVALGVEVVIGFYEGTTSWIYWDTLNEKLSPEQFPRITVLVAAGSGVRLGFFEAPVESTISVQFDIYAKEKASNQIFDIEGKNYTGEELVERIAYDVQRAFESYEGELHPVLYDYNPTQFPPRNIPFDESLQCHRKILECELSGIKIGGVV